MSLMTGDGHNSNVTRSIAYFCFFFFGPPTETSQSTWHAQGSSMPGHRKIAMRELSLRLMSLSFYF